MDIQALHPLGQIEPASHFQMPPLQCLRVLQIEGLPILPGDVQRQTALQLEPKPAATTVHLYDPPAQQMKSRFISPQARCLLRTLGPHPGASAASPALGIQIAGEISEVGRNGDLITPARQQQLPGQVFPPEIEDMGEEPAISVFGLAPRLQIDAPLRLADQSLQGLSGRLGAHPFRFAVAADFRCIETDQTDFASIAQTNRIAIDHRLDCGHFGPFGSLALCCHRRCGGKE